MQSVQISIDTVNATTGASASLFNPFSPTYVSSSSTRFRLIWPTCQT
jgi:hypothetical protein